MRLLCAVMLLVLLCASAHAQLRVVTYNTAIADPFGSIFTARPGLDVVLEAIGEESNGAFAKPIDILLLQEQHSTEESTQSIVDLLNGIYGSGTYARSSINGQNTGPSGSGGAPALVYNTQTIELIDEIQFGNVGNGEFQQPRATLRYQLRPVGYDSAADFYAYNSHYKADDGTVNNNRRLAEAQSIRANVDALGEGTHALFVGDYNIASSGAAMYQHLLASGPGQAFDPIDTPGSWSDNPAFKSVHTQSPASTADAVSGLAGGGVDDRFDFQLVTGEVLDGEGFSYIPGTYHAFGNNGTHECSGTGSNDCIDSINTGTGASPAVLEALMDASDHLPVVADYQLPAKMLASIAFVPSNVAFGSTVGVDVFVQNIANVLAVNGADELDYTINVSGALLGSATGTTLPLAAANAHQIFLDTGATGFRSGVVTVEATSQGAANALYHFPVSFTVGGGNGGPVFGVIGKDTFDEDMNLLSFSQSPAEPFSDPQDGFGVYQVGVSSSIPNALKDDSNNGFSIDALGVVDTATKLDRWFGINDLENPGNTEGTGTVTWEFDVSGAIDMQVSIDMAAMGDFESGEDVYDWTYQIDDGPVLELFTSSVDDEHPSVPYTMADGDVVNLADPLFMENAQGSIVQLTNSFQTLTSLISGLGDVLTITLNAANNADEPFAFDNLTIEGTTFVEFLAADFNQDGMVDSDDLAEWQEAFGLGDGADADFDGDTDGRDFIIWQRQFGQSIPGLLSASTADVPEPTTAILLVIMSVAAGWLRRSS